MSVTQARSQGMVREDIKRFDVVEVCEETYLFDKH